MTQTLYDFGEFEIDCARFELRRNGRVVKLEDIPMELLILLAEKDGSVVTRQGSANSIYQHHAEYGHGGEGKA